MKRHSAQWNRLIIGAIFILISGWWILAWDGQRISISTLAFAIPALLIGAGFIGLVSTLGMKSKKKDAGSGVDSADSTD